MQDMRNVVDEFKGMPESEIIERLDKADHGLIIALENTEREFSMGTIIRSANAFGVRNVYIIGRKQWNKRGAMMTDKYLHIHYTETTSDFIDLMHEQNRTIIAIDNVAGSTPLAKTPLERNAVLVFGQEGPGISDEMIGSADKIVAIEQFGSTRSLNVATASTVAMYEWLRRHVLGA